MTAAQRTVIVTLSIKKEGSIISGVPNVSYHKHNCVVHAEQFPISIYQRKDQYGKRPAAPNPMLWNVTNV